MGCNHYHSEVEGSEEPHSRRNGNDRNGHKNLGREKGVAYPPHTHQEEVLLKHAELIHGFSANGLFL